jgi:hypothetical protein
LGGNPRAGSTPASASVCLSKCQLTLPIYHAVISALTQLAPKARVYTTYTPTAAFKNVGLNHFVLRNAVYIVVLDYPNDYSGGMMEAPSARVEVYRLPPVPANYKARRTARKDAGKGSFPLVPDEPPLEAYVNDFYDYYTNDRQDKNGLKFERIHAAPPADEGSKQSANFHDDFPSSRCNGFQFAEQLLLATCWTVQ